jgi:cysteine desulfurase/selenocysteine lyase
MGLFGTPKAASSAGSFAYLPSGSCYLDSACQTLRPQEVIDAEARYYREFNSCAGRAKYGWGRKTDDEVRATREEVLAYLGLSSKEYVVAFTLNTSYGINLVLHQLNATDFARIVTSEIEHNSVMLPTMTWAERNSKERLVLPRAEDGALAYRKDQLETSVVLVNTMSNIDGRVLSNVRELVTDAHEVGGIVLLDAAQHMAHDVSVLKGIPFDALFFSSHKMYGPSLGVVVIRRNLLATLQHFLLGEGTVHDIELASYTLLRAPGEEHAPLEVGLQNWAGIVGFREALAWLQRQKDRHERERALAEQLFAGLQNLPRVHLVNHQASPVVSFWIDGVDAHKAAMLLDEAGVQCRTGHFCCHAYLQHVRNLPPLVRASLGLHLQAKDIEHFLEALTTILSTF